MAMIRELKEPEFSEWVASRPECIQTLIKRLPPDRLYRLKPTGSRVELLSYAENGTVTVLVLGKWNLCIFERSVFGINPDDLEECELPEPGEVLGAAMDFPMSVDN